MKDKIKKIVEDFDKLKISKENKILKKYIESLKNDYEVLHLDNIANENEISVLKEENKHLQIQKRQYLNAYKHKKEELRRIKMMLMQEGTTLKDIKNALGVK